MSAASNVDLIRAAEAVLNPHVSGDRLFGLGWELTKPLSDLLPDYEWPEPLGPCLDVDGGATVDSGAASDTPVTARIQTPTPPPIPAG